MMRAAAGVIALAAASYFSAAGVAAAQVTIDCSTRSSAVARVICGTPFLAAAKVEMDATYEAAWTTSLDREWLRIQQEVWIETLNTQCLESTDDECLLRVLKERTRRLKGISVAFGGCEAVRKSEQPLVCTDPTLAALLSEDDDDARALAERAVTPAHRFMIREDQSAWRVNIMGGAYEACAVDPNGCIAWITDQLKARHAQLEFFNAKPGLAPTLAVNLPPDWWGVDIASLAQGEKLYLEYVLTDSDGRIVLALDDGNRQWRFIDAVSGNPLRTMKREFEPPASLFDRLGYKYQKPTISRLDQSTDITLRSHDDSCEPPLNGWIGQIADQHGLLANSRLVFRRLESPGDFHEGVRCEDGIETILWAADFENLIPWNMARLPDGTVLIQYRGQKLDTAYLVRFRPDLTSPFFEGRSDIVLIPKLQSDLLSMSGEESPGGTLRISKRYTQALSFLIERGMQAQITPHER